MATRNTILIVDDVELNRAILCEMFQGRYEILEAENGQEALGLIERHADSLAMILLDVIMPVMDGIEVLRRLRGSRRIESVPVVLITAENNESTALEGYTIGVSDIVNKPFNPEIVRRRVENLIELYTHKRHLEDKLQEQYEILENQSKKLKQANAFVIDTLSTVVEFRNCESGSHIRRIRKITNLLLGMLSARYPQYRFSKEQIAMITDASALHDIGKIAIPDSVLLKPGKLTPEEFEVMKTHTLRGCEILRSLDYVRDEEFYNYCYEICRHHHERWDGGGYPDGLCGDQISIWAQVVSLADVYEALTSERVYKPPYSHEEAIQMILGEECGAFNPQLLKCFVEIAQQLKDCAAALEPPQMHALSGPASQNPFPPPKSDTLSERTLWLLELEREKYRALSELSGEITFDYDPQEDLLKFSEKFTGVFGGSFRIPNAGQALRASKKLLPEDKKRILEGIADLSPLHPVCRLELRIETASGEFQWFEVSINALWKGATNPAYVNLIGKLTNIHAVKLETARLRKRAVTDSLTGMYNRKAFQELVSDSHSQEQLAPGALFFLDIDDFKAINDEYGHPYGDQVLQKVSEHLRSFFRTTDIIGRIGGDEFVIFLKGNSQRQTLEHKAAEVCGLFQKISEALGCSRAVSGSLGVACCPANGTTFRTVLAKADSALYQAKKQGKNCYAFYEEEGSATETPAAPPGAAY